MNPHPGNKLKMTSAITYFFYLADEDGGTMLITDKFVFLHLPRAVSSLTECK